MEESSQEQQLEVLQAGAARLGVPLEAGMLERFAIYYRELAKAAPLLDLTSVVGPEEVQRRHFLESLAVGRALEELGVLDRERPLRAIDIGAGAGFPGLPIRLAWPRLRLTLLEASRRKAEFLRRLVDALGLGDVEVVWARAEELARQPAHRESYDLALARAVTSLPVLVELSLPLLRVGGYLAAPKGSRALQEVAEARGALAACGGDQPVVHPLPPLGGGTLPLLVLVRKAQPTPERYPRRPGIPEKRPLR